MIRNAGKLSANHRLAMPYRTIARWGEERRAAIVAEAEAFLDALPTGYA